MRNNFCLENVQGESRVKYVSFKYIFIHNETVRHKLKGDKEDLENLDSVLEVNECGTFCVLDGKH